MYAIVAGNGTQGRQYWVEEGQEILVDLLAVEPGASIDFDRVLMVGGRDDGTLIGAPTVPGAKVTCDVVDHIRTPKIFVQVYKRRKNYRKKRGHRQSMTKLRINRIITE